MDDQRPQWVPVTKVSKFIKVTDAEMLNSAITLAAQNGWLMVGGQPVHSVFLTDTGETVALKKSGHANVPTPKTARIRLRKK